MEILNQVEEKQIKNDFNVYCINPVGLILNDFLYLSEFRDKNPILISEIRKIKFLKKRDLTVNFIFGFITFSILLCSFFFYYSFPIVFIFLMLSCLVLIYLTYKISNHFYRIIIECEDGIKSVKVDKQHKIDAIKIIKNIKIKNNSSKQDVIKLKKV